MRSLHSPNKLPIVVGCLGCAALCCTAAFTQVIDLIDNPVVDLVDGPVNVVLRFELPAGQGPAQSPGQDASTTSVPSTELSPDISDPSRGVAFYTANYTSLRGKQLPFHIVGTDPSLGANTTTVPTVLVPLEFIFVSKAIRKLLILHQSDKT